MSFDKHIKTTWLCYRCDTKHEEITRMRHGDASKIIMICLACGALQSIDVPIIGASITEQTVLEDQITIG